MPYSLQKITNWNSILAKKNINIGLVKVQAITMLRFIWQVLVPILLLDSIINDIDAFNLENRLPIVKYGDVSTYFGYSVASHVIGERDDIHKKNWWDYL